MSVSSGVTPGAGGGVKEERGAPEVDRVASRAAALLAQALERVLRQSARVQRAHPAGERVRHRQRRRRPRRR